MAAIRRPPRCLRRSTMSEHLLLQSSVRSRSFNAVAILPPLPPATTLRPAQLRLNPPESHTPPLPSLMDAPGFWSRAHAHCRVHLSVRGTPPPPFAAARPDGDDDGAWDVTSPVRNGGGTGPPARAVAITAGD
uniref:Uncharacterized protein n=1 Tax=Oryza glumipatula TaxID=40148 RepID=A0A0D9ZVK2_9ORYZ